MLSAIDQFLGCTTPEAWVKAACRNLDILLLDHKACELKAAATAMLLINQYPRHVDLLNKMSRLAREELRHFEQVLAILKKRNIPLTNVTASRYAKRLREQVRKQEPGRLIDMLIVGALIEARSCERFVALLPYLDEALAKFYGSLLRSESRHFQDYLKLAYQYGDKDDVDRSVAAFCRLEADLIVSPDDQFRFHSGIPVVADD